MDPFKNIADERTSYQSVSEQFYDERLGRSELSKQDWPPQIDRAAIDIKYGIAIGKINNQTDIGGTIGRSDFGEATGEHYVDGLKAIAGTESDLPRIISQYDSESIGEAVFKLNELRIELEKIDDHGKQISNLNRAIEAIVEKLATRAAHSATGRQPLQAPEAVTDVIQQLFSDPSTTSYADELLTAIERIDMQEGLLGHLDRPQMVTPLWEHQRKALANWHDAGKKGYVDMATATGKTVLGLAAIAQQFGDLHPYDAEEIPDESAGKRPERVLIVAGQDLLLEQWQSEFDEHLNIPRDRMQTTGDNRIVKLDWGTIEFRPAQSLLATERLPSYDLVILDEAHRYRRGTSGGRGWRDLFETLITNSECILAMSGSVDQDWIGDATAREALESNLTQCMEFTVADAREANVIADFSWSICYASSSKGDALKSVAESTKKLAAVYDSENHKFLPHNLTGDIPDIVDETYETLRDVRGFAHSKDGNKAREVSAAFDTFVTAAFARQPKRWQLRPPNNRIKQLLDPHYETEKAIVLAQSYAQANAIGVYLTEHYGQNLVTVPDQNNETHFDVISEFKEKETGILIGPGEVFGVGIDLPNVDVAVNLSKGGVNASLVQRIGRVLRNPSGTNRAQFYQVITLPATPEARLAGEDGRRRLRRASEFRALGARFRELPGFIAIDRTSKDVLLEMETHGAMATVKDHRSVEEIIEDDVAADNLSSILTAITSADGTQSEPVLTTTWQPESVNQHTNPVRAAVEETDNENETMETDRIHPLTVTIVDRDNIPISNVEVTVSSGSFNIRGTTDNQGQLKIEVPTEIDAVDIECESTGYEQSLSRLHLSGGYTTTTIPLFKDIENHFFAGQTSSSQGTVPDKTSSHDVPVSQDNTHLSDETPLREFFENISGVGRVTHVRLQEIGIKTVGDLRASTEDEIVEADYVGPNTAKKLYRHLESEFELLDDDIAETESSDLQSTRTITIQLITDDGPITGASVVTTGAETPSQTSAVGICDIRIPTDATCAELSIEHPKLATEDFVLELSPDTYFYTIQCGADDQSSKTESNAETDTTGNDSKEDDGNPNQSIVDDVMSRLDF